MLTSPSFQEVSCKNGTSLGMSFLESSHGGFSPTKPMGFPTKNDHFGVCFWGNHHFGKPPHGTGTSRQAARLPCLWAGLPGLKWKPLFFGGNCNKKHILKKSQWEIYTQSIHVWCISLHLPLMKFYKDQANVYRYSKYTSAMDGTVV